MNSIWFPIAIMLFILNCWVMWMWNQAENRADAVMNALLTIVRDSNQLTGTPSSEPSICTENDDIRTCQLEVER